MREFIVYLLVFCLSTLPAYGGGIIHRRIVSGGGATACTPPASGWCDNFDRGDVNPIGGNWTTLPTYWDVRILNNMMAGAHAGPTSTMAYWNANTPNTSQYAEVSIGAGQVVSYQGAIVRDQNINNGTFYVLWATDNVTLGLQQWNAGVPAALGTLTVPAIVPGDTIRLSVEGPSCGPRLKRYINGSLQGSVVSDTSSGRISAAGYTGVHTWQDGTVGLDNFIGGNLVDPGGTAPAYDNTGSGYAENGTSTLSWTHTMGSGSNRIVLAWIALDNSVTQISSITYAGGAMTAVPNGSTGTGKNQGKWYYTLAPASGSQTIQVIVSGAGHYGLIGESISFSGVDQTTPFGTIVSASSTSPTSSYLCAWPEGQKVVIVDGVSAIWNGTSSTLTVGSNQTQIQNVKAMYATAGISTEPFSSYDNTVWTSSVVRDLAAVAFSLNGI